MPTLRVGYSHLILVPDRQLTMDENDPTFAIPVADDWSCWHTSALYNPSCDEPRRLAFEPPWPAGRLFASTTLGDVPSGPTIFYAAFDLSYAPASQLAQTEYSLRQARTRLREATKPRSTQHRKKFDLYLRLLDARDAGATARAIADHLNNEVTPTLDDQEINKRIALAKQHLEPERYWAIIRAPR